MDHPDIPWKNEHVWAWSDVCGEELHMETCHWEAGYDTPCTPLKGVGSGCLKFLVKKRPLKQEQQPIIIIALPRARISYLCMTFSLDLFSPRLL